MDHENNMVLLEIDAARRCVTPRQVGMWQDMLVSGKTEDFAPFIQRIAAFKIMPQDRAAFLHHLSLDLLQSLAKREEGRVAFDFQAPDSAGVLGLFTCTIFPSAGHISCRITASDSLSANSPASDPLTGLLSQKAAEQQIKAYLETAPAAERSFCILFQLSAPSEDAAALQDAMLFAAQIVKQAVPAAAVAGRYGESSFLIFLPRGNHEMVSAAVRGLAKTIHERFPQVHARAGAAVYPLDAPDLRTLVRCALAAAQRHTHRESAVCWYSGTAALPMPIPKRPKASAGLGRFRQTPWLRFTRFCRANAKTVWTVAGMVCLLTVVLTMICSSYLVRLKTMVQEESAGYLLEVSRQINQNVQTLIESNFTTLTLLGESAHAASPESIAQMQDNLRAKQNQFASIPFSTIALLDNKGYWYMDGKKRAYPDMAQFVSKVVINRQPSMSTALRMEDGEYIVFAVPIPESVIEGERIVGLVGAIDLTSMHDIISLDAFDHQGYAYIVTKNGTAVVRPHSYSAASGAFNIISAMQDAALEDPSSITKLQSDMKNGGSGQIRYLYKGEEKLMTYMPVGIGDWYLLTVIPTSTSAAKSDAFFRFTLLCCIIISVLFLLLLLLVFGTHLRSKMRLERLAFLDDVTGGRNLRCFESDVARQLSAFRGKYAMVYANVHKFKFLNDQLGRQKADRLLACIYAVIEQDLTSSEYIGRLMADHFGILLHTQSKPEIAQRLAGWNRAIQNRLHQLGVTCSAVLTYGIYPIPEASQYDAAGLLDNADIARKTLQTVQPDALNFAFYDSALRKHIREERELEGRMEQALQSGEFSLYLQPKYDLASGQVCGLEALTRWEIPGRGKVYPDLFIPLFERNGFIVKLDEYIFDRACQFVRRMLDEGKQPVCVSVNLSRAGLDDPDFLNKYERIWKRSGIPARYIELEFTETMIYDSMQKLNAVIADIHKIGFRCSMDDFGSGYSSLNMLRNIDVDIIKLDRNFFGHQEVTEDKGLVIIKNIIHLAKELDMLVVAEGVEEKWQADCLKCFGCDMVQGYYFAKPMPEKDVPKLL